MSKAISIGISFGSGDDEDMSRGSVRKRLKEFLRKESVRSLPLHRRKQAMKELEDLDDEDDDEEMTEQEKNAELKANAVSASNPPKEVSCPGCESAPPSPSKRPRKTAKKAK